MKETIERTRQEIAVYAESPLGEVRTVENMEPGDWARQGDVYAVMVAQVPENVRLVAERQLAPGVTQGSRHTVGDEVSVYRRKDHGQIERGASPAPWARSVGHVVECRDRFTLSHPEHADVSLPAGCYQIYGQVDAATGQRARD